MLRALSGLVLIAVGMVAGPAALPSTVAAVGPLPECRVDDILTVPRRYENWNVTLVDWLLSVGADYAPPDLVSVNEAGLAGGGSISRVALADTQAMAQAARANGTPIGSWSAYRSYDQQVELFNGYVNAYGYENAIEFSHRPGHSEHQLGLAVDFMSAGGGSPMRGDWATTPAGRWMRDHGWEYGWVMSYPLLDPNTLWQEPVCFRYEPWHYRYLGRDIAAQVHASGLTIREYLWTHFTMVDPTTGQPLVTPTPSPTPTPLATPTPSPSPTPSATASPLSPTASPVAEAPPPEAGLAVQALVVGTGLALLLALVLAAIRRRQ